MMNSAYDESDAALDTAVIEDIRALGGDDDPALVERLVRMFLQEARAHVEELGAAARSREADGVAKAAHRLHGSSGFVGAIGLQAICADVELQAGQGNLAGVDDQLQRIEHALDTLTPRLLAIAGRAG